MGNQYPESVKVLKIYQIDINHKKRKKPRKIQHLIIAVNQ